LKQTEARRKPADCGGLTYYIEPTFNICVIPCVCVISACLWITQPVPPPKRQRCRDPTQTDTIAALSTGLLGTPSSTKAPSPKSARGCHQVGGRVTAGRPGGRPAGIVPFGPGNTARTGGGPIGPADRHGQEGVSTQDRPGVGHSLGISHWRQFERTRWYPLGPGTAPRKESTETTARGGPQQGRSPTRAANHHARGSDTPGERRKPLTEIVNAAHGGGYTMEQTAADEGTRVREGRPAQGNKDGTTPGRSAEGTKQHNRKKTNTLTEGNERSGG